MPIRTKLLLVLLVLSLGPLALVGILTYHYGRRAIEDSLGVVFERRAARAIEMLDREVEAARHGAETWAGLEVMQDVITNDPDGRVSAFLIEQSRGAQTIALALVIAPAGEGAAAGLREWKVKAASRPDWLGRTVATLAPRSPGGEACRDGSLEAAPVASPLLTCSFPIRAAFDRDEVIGRLVVTFDLSHAIDRLQRAGEREAPPVEMLFIRPDGPAIPALRPEPERPVHSDFVHADESRAARLAGEGRSGFVVESLGGRDHLVGFSRSSGVTGWSVLVGQHGSDAFAPVYRLRLGLLGLATVIAALVVGFSFALARRVTSPILELTSAARRVAGGDLEPTLPPRSRDEIGDLIGGFAHMVGELRSQRTQLVEKDYLDSIIAHVVDGLIVVSAEGTLLTANPALYDIAGHQASAAIGHSAAALFAEGEEGFKERVLEPVHREGEVRSVELGLLDAARRPVPISLSAGALPRGPEGTGAIVCLLTDITPMKDAEAALVRAREQAEAGARAKARFLAVMSHEIRTPLNGIIGMLELLASSGLNPKQSDYAETAQRSGEALLAVVGDILDYSKLDAGRLELESLEFDPRATVEGVADALAPRARERGLELTVTCDPSLPGRVRGDEGRLRQVLLNLGSNAVKFTPQGHVLLRAAPDPDRPSVIRFEVVDTGIGIPPEGREKLFHPFSQVDASTTRKYGGTGLGLAISSQLVGLMGGEIGVDTEDGKGSLFWVSVPLPAVDGSPREAAPVPLAALRVLVVDDNETNRDVVCEMLERWDCRPTEAADGWEALQILRAATDRGEAFDLALLDFQMPEMDGSQLAAAIKKDPRLASLPLVLLTSVPQQSETARQMGFEACLTKPIKRSALRQVIESGVASVAGGAGESASAAAPPEGSASGRGRVLVVDDDSTSRQVAVELLEKAGCSCEAVASGAAALDAVERETYDMVFMDCQMPAMDGYETTRRIRAEHDRNERLVIVAMTGDAFSEDRERCLAAGMNDHVAKPVRSADFERVLTRYKPA